MSEETVTPEEMKEHFASHAKWQRHGITMLANAAQALTAHDSEVEDDHDAMLNAENVRRCLASLEILLLPPRRSPAARALDALADSIGPMLPAIVEQVDRLMKAGTGPIVETPVVQVPENPKEAETLSDEALDAALALLNEEVARRRHVKKAWNYVLIDRSLSTGWADTLVLMDDLTWAPNDGVAPPENARRFATHAEAMQYASALPPRPSREYVPTPIA